MPCRIASITVLALACLPVAATAGSSRPVRTDEIRTVVLFGDLDLTTADGAKVLERRVRTAAGTSCHALYRGDDLAILFKAGCTQHGVLAARAQLRRAIELARSQKSQGSELAFNVRR